jgi:hypothetical protein
VRGLLCCKKESHGSGNYTTSPDSQDGTGYKSMEESRDAVQLVFNNCKSYNDPTDSEVYRMAELFLKKFEMHWEKVEKEMQKEELKWTVGLRRANVKKEA